MHRSHPFPWELHQLAEHHHSGIHRREIRPFRLVRHLEHRPFRPVGHREHRPCRRERRPFLLPVDEREHRQLGYRRLSDP